MQVFVLVGVEAHDSVICGVYSSMALAESAKDSFDANSFCFMTIQTYFVDPTP